jgi:hypothetical protein
MLAIAAGNDDGTMIVSDSIHILSEMVTSLGIGNGIHGHKPGQKAVQIILA